jgi:hypothetical protein
MSTTRRVRTSSFRIPVVFLGIVVALMPAANVVGQASNRAASRSSQAWHLHSRVPLGSDTLRLNPSHQIVSILALAESPQFEGWSLALNRQKPALLDVSGKPVQALPRLVTFRVTAGTRDKVMDGDPLPLDVSQDLNSFLLGLHFEAEVFRGMAMRRLQPVSASMIGVPATESSDERIYRVKFDFGNVRPDDRIVLIVNDASGQRLTKFHLEFL